MSMLGFLIDSSLILVLGLSAACVLRRSSAASRHLVWAAALTAVALLPLFYWVLPRYSLRWLPAVAEGGSPIASPLPQTEAALPSSGIPLLAADTAMLDFWGLGVLGLWLLGIVWGLGSLGVGVGRLAWISRRARDLEETPPRSGWLGVSGVLPDLPRPPRVLTHRLVRVPLTFGFRRPVILLPESSSDWSPALLQSVLAHEMAHVARRDWIVQVAVRALCSIFWFHPLIWLAAVRLGLEAERACDDRVLANGVSAVGYAEHLLYIARQARPPKGLTGAVAMARRPVLTRRVAAILDPSIRRSTMQKPQMALIFLAALGLVAALASAELAPADPDERRAESGFEGALDWPLYKAAEGGDLAVVERLVAVGADVNAALAGDGSPLIAAARSGHLEVVRLLVAAGADVDGAVSGDGNPLIMAAREGRNDVVRFLLDAGASIDAVVPGDETALIQAAWQGRRNTVRLLIDYGADVNLSVTVDGNTWREKEIRSPLSMARREGHRAVEELLLAAGARE